MNTFQELHRAKSLGLNLTSLLVKAYLDQHGPTPIGLVARACDLSVRSVERAIAALKAKGLFFENQTTKMTHDHDHSDLQRIRGSASALTDETVIPDAPAPTPVADPLAAALLEAEVLPWCVEILMAKVDRQVLEKQLTYHRHRLANGFPFKAHPAKFLFRACLNDYPPPQDYFAAQNRTAVAEPQAPTPERAPAVAPVVEMTRDGAMTVIRMGLRSKLPVLREQALRLAAEWAIDPASLAG